MTSEEIRQKFLAFFAKRGHVIVPSASLIPSEYGDEGTLFTTAGMQPMIPYLLGKPHPEGRRVVDVQKCVRTGDIDDVGDNRHLTFFEMMGNWSFGDPDAQDGIGSGYFKKESINWSFEFLTDKEDGLGLDPQRLYVTVFKGENDIPRDDESIKIWQEVFTEAGLLVKIAGEDEIIDAQKRIVPLGANDNFWIAGATGPCGADTEIFYDTRPEEKMSGKFSDLVNSFRFIEVWNNVFMEFNKTSEGKYEMLAQKNVDTGMGLERTTAVINGIDVFATDLFAPIMAETRKISPDEKSARIIADHLRTAVFMISEGIKPSNVERGYILRRLLRRAIIRTKNKKLELKDLSILVDSVINKYQKIYPELNRQKDYIKKIIEDETLKFSTTINKGLKEFEKIDQNQKISGEQSFILFSTYGFPLELILEIAKEKNIVVDEKGFWEEMKKHQELSKSGAEQKFKGGLAGESEQIIKYHTATHLLHQALRDVLGPNISQKGSNITEERLRFDFTFGEKMTEEQKNEVEKIVNEKIAANLPVNKIELPKEEAEKTGALHFFGEKYGETVCIYFIGDNLETAYSKEFCGGPHVENTGNLGHFKIKKEESVSAGVRRIKAVLE